MRKTILLVSLAGTCALTLHAQEHLFSTWMVNTEGTTAQYWQTPMGGGTPTLVDLGEEANVQKVAYDDDFAYIETQGLAEEMGPCTNPGNPSGQDHVWKIPKNPVENTGTKTETPVIASVGVLINGVAIYSLSNAKSYSQSSNSNEPNGDGVWWGDAYLTEGETLDDKLGAHPQQQGEYHSHAVPSDLYSSTGTNEHSPLVGWAWDGFPVYGPYGYSDPNDASSSIKRMESGYAVRNITQRHSLPDGTSLSASEYGPDVNASFPIGTYLQDYAHMGTGDLDEYNGRFCKTPDYPDGIYAYFVTIEANGDPAFPFYIGFEYYGIVEESNTGIGGGKDPIPGNAQEYDPLTVTEVASGNQVKIYPNPSSGIISLEDMSAKFDKINVINMSGRVIYSTAFYQTGTSQQIDFGFLATGSYILQLKGDNVIENKSLVIQ